MTDSSVSRSPSGSVGKKERRRRIATARRQWALLGRFVQSFEEVVGALRRDCIEMTHRLKWDPATHQKAVGVRAHIATIIFNHSAMTARPMIELWRAITVMHLCSFDLTDHQIEVCHGVIDQVASEFAVLLERRNEIVHAEWDIGQPWTFDFPEAPLADKMRVGKRGLAAFPKLPKSEGQLEEQILACRRLYGLIGRFGWVITMCRSEVQKAFLRDQAGRWAPDKTFLPSRYKRPPAPGDRAGG